MQTIANNLKLFSNISLISSHRIIIGEKYRLKEKMTTIYTARTAHMAENTKKEPQWSNYGVWDRMEMAN